MKNLAREKILILAAALAKQAELLRQENMATAANALRRRAQLYFALDAWESTYRN